MDLGSYLSSLHGIKEYLSLGIVEREYEATRQIYRNREKIVEFYVKDSEIRCISNVLASREDLYRVLGVSSDREAYDKILYGVENPLQLNTVSFNEYFKESDLSLWSLPFMKYFREDGGYYLTSSILIACIDRVCNASFHRMMYIDREKAVVRIVPRHLYHIYSRYRERGRDTPVAVVLGVHPIYEIASAITTRYGLFELEIAARLLSDNRVVKTPRYGIPVPATASIVLEGVISRDEYVDEGPFTDILGLTDIKRKQPVFRLEAIYVSRVVPQLYHAIVPSLWEHVYLMGFPREALIYGVLKSVSPSIKSIRLSPGSGGWLHAIVSIKQSRPGEARNIGLSVIHAHPSVKHVVVVDDDIDVDDPYMVEWAIATRVRGSEDIIVLRDFYGSTLDPRSRDGLGDKVIIDATKPFDEPWDKYRRVEIP